MIFYSLISQNAPVLQCLQGGKISPATICILFSFSVGWHALFSICPAKWYVPVEGTNWSVWNFPITPNIILFDIRFKTIIRILILDRYCQASVSTPQVLNSFVVHKKIVDIKMANIGNTSADGTHSCDSCNSGSQVEWCESCKRFMCKNCDNEVHSVSLP